jgi:nucleoside-diphosphate-sugar epimerase
MAVERAVVTGGAGFVGSSVAEALVEGLRRTLGWIRSR